MTADPRSHKDKRTLAHTPHNAGEAGAAPRAPAGPAQAVAELRLYDNENKCVLYRTVYRLQWVTNALTVTLSTADDYRE